MFELNDFCFVLFSWRVVCEVIFSLTSRSFCLDGKVRLAPRRNFWPICNLAKNAHSVFAQGLRPRLESRSLFLVLEFRESFIDSGKIFCRSLLASTFLCEEVGQLLEFSCGARVCMY